MVPGFRSAAAAAGLKKHGGLDLGLIVSDEPAGAAGVFTTNRVRAAPVVLSQEHIIRGEARAILANAGCANACTGTPGLEDARKTADAAGKALGVQPEEVLVASTGVIGARLDVDGITGALPGLVAGLSEEDLPRVAEAVMTTDSFPKLSRFDGSAGGRPYRIVGIAKGAGMIMPDMATMLSFVLTDAGISSLDLKKSVIQAADATFNRITVDGDTSTNDTVFALASGRAGTGGIAGKDLAGFREGLCRVMEELAVMIVRDGEGATRVVHVLVQGAGTAEEASQAARTVANSNLVKTAVCGRDPNWGRIMAALGRSGVSMEEGSVDIRINDVEIVENGLGKGAQAEKAAAAVMAGEETIHLTIHLHQGEHEDRVTTCDLTQEYVAINADYRT
ncbi:MAG: bifunctional glutamate N-acetyltransferase/amino-acid acetyltransferase ArgJ [Deltaproteobacteria bacterium]|nr:bifunctional glutamate N-acetyltransferase/amino-acid acetyltransferase ArgJ [Deltaproteobacteria bacterium]